MIRPGKAARTVVAIVIALLLLLPLWWVTIGAFRPEDGIFRFLPPLTTETLLPP
jgi:ABC-type glycerol-3-phosphate transport system permease component